MSNLLTINDGKLSLSKNGYGKIVSLSAYVCRPDRKPMSKINGISTLSPTIKFNDISEISMEVHRYILNRSTYEWYENPAYQWLRAFCGVYIPEFGTLGYFLINNEPTIDAKGTRNETKTVSLEVYQSILQYENLLVFDINQGTETSCEMYKDNLDEIGLPKANVKFYNPDNEKLSLLHLVLRDDYYGWKIGTIDKTLWTKEAAFSVDSQNIYSFLTSDVATAFRCIFQFDTVNKTINAYAVDNEQEIGKSTDIYMDFNHFVQELQIEPQSDEMYTVFNVAGEDDLNISAVNFGSNKIVNIDYPILFLDSDLQKAWEEYKVFYENKRKAYEDDLIKYNTLLAQWDSVMNRQPDDDLISKELTSFVDKSDDDLKTDLKACEAIRDKYQKLYVDSSGKFDEDALNASVDASLYHTYVDVIMVDIQNEIDARAKEGTVVAKTVDSSKVWQAHGLNDLKTDLKAVNEQISLYEKGGYDKEPSDSTLITGTWMLQHQNYLDYVKQKNELTDLITKKQKQADSLKAQYESALADAKSVASSVQLSTYFSAHPDWVAIITSLYKESDYQDSNYLVTDKDTAQEKIDEAEKLYQAAKKRLEIESRPQLKWTVTSANLFAIPMLDKLRKQIQLGDYINLRYGKVVDKFRIVQIEFDGLNISSSFQLTFSDMTTTTTFRNDFESLLNDYISSQTNSITQRVTSSATSSASDLVSSMISGYITSLSNKMDSLTVNQAYVKDLTAERANVQTLISNTIDTHDFTADVAKITKLTASDAIIDNLKTLILNTDTLGAAVANITQLNTDSAFAKYLKANYADLDLANVSQLNAQKFIAGTGLIDNATISDGYITGRLHGVKVSASDLTAGTIDAGNISVTNLKVDNINGVPVSSGTSTNLNTIISAIEEGTTNAQKTADGKNTVYYSSTTPDSTKVKLNTNDLWYDKANGYKMYYWSGTAWTPATFGADALADNAVTEDKISSVITNKINNAVSDANTASTNASDAIKKATSANETANDVKTRADNREFDATVVYIHSSKGSAFKNNEISTVLTVTVIHGALSITDQTALEKEYGTGSYLQWKCRLYGQTEYSTILSTDTRMSENGFKFTVSPSDVDTQAVFEVELVTPD